MLENVQDERDEISAESSVTNTVSANTRPSSSMSLQSSAHSSTNNLASKQTPRKRHGTIPMRIPMPSVQSSPASVSSARKVTQTPRTSSAFTTPRTPGDGLNGRVPFEVCIRLRPLSDGEAPLHYEIHPDGIQVAHDQASVEGNSVEEVRNYEFAHNLDVTTTDEDVLALVQPKVLDQVQAGYNATILCYGQTGSGKTHTVSRLQPQLIESIFKANELEQAAAGVTHVVELTYLQVYNNSVFNLLEGGEHGATLPKPKGRWVPDPRLVVTSAAHVVELLSDAQMRRAVASHALNNKSSRSHTIMLLIVKRFIDGTEINSSRLTVVDLAGSERLKRTHATGEVAEEAKSINKSLSALSRVIEAAAEGQSIPFRDNILTLYLAPSLSNSFVFLIATCATEASSFSETKATLEFATIAKKCAVTRRRGEDRSASSSTVTHLKSEIDALRNRLVSVQMESENTRQRNVLLEQQGSRSEALTSEITQHKEHISQLERQEAKFMVLLKEKESELASAATQSKEVDSRIEELQHELDEAMAYKDSLSVSNEQKDVSIAELRAEREQYETAFKWKHTKLVETVAKCSELQSTLEHLREDLRTCQAQLRREEAKSVKLECDVAEVKGRETSFRRELERLRLLADEHEMRFCKEQNDHAALKHTFGMLEAELMALRGGATNNFVASTTTEMANALERQEAEMEHLYLELDKKNLEIERLQAAAAQTPSFAASYHPPQEFYSAVSDASADGSGHFAAAEPQGRCSHTAHLTNLYSEAVQTIRSKDDVIEDLERQLECLTAGLLDRDNEYKVLQDLDELRDAKESDMENCLLIAYNELEAHTAQREALQEKLEATLREQERFEKSYELLAKQCEEVRARLVAKEQDLRAAEEDKILLTERMHAVERDRETLRQKEATTQMNTAAQELEIAQLKAQLQKLQAGMGKAEADKKRSGQQVGLIMRQVEDSRRREHTTHATLTALGSRVAKPSPQVAAASQRSRINIRRADCAGPEPKRTLAEQNITLRNAFTSQFASQQLRKDPFALRTFSRHRTSPKTHRTVPHVSSQASSTRSHGEGTAAPKHPLNAAALNGSVTKMAATTKGSPIPFPRKIHHQL